MKKINKLVIGLFITAGILSSCQDNWDSHYSQKEVQTGDDASVEVVNMNSVDYIASQSGYSEIYQVFKDNGLITALNARQQLYTILICDNDAMASQDINDVNFFINSSICDIALSPSQIADGSTMKMWCGKYLKIAITEEAQPNAMANGDTTNTQKVIRISGKKVMKIIQTKDAFIYVMEAPVLAPKSLYEVFEDLDEVKYSRFKALVRSYESKDFDKASSTPVGVDKTGNTVYDSVFIIKNLYLDRYKKYDATNKVYTDPTWNMRSEAYTSTMLVPSDEIFNQCIEEACTNTLTALGRPATGADSLKFYEWMLRACFYNGELTPEQLNGDADITSIGGYCLKYTGALTGAQWRPTVQKVEVNNPIALSNGFAYHITKMKVPTNIVLWRIKNRMAVCWNACSADEKAAYFVWENENTGKIGVTNKTGNNGPYGDKFPLILYDYLYAPCSQAAIDGKLPVSLTFICTTVKNDGTVAKVMVPPGEYYLRAGSSYTNNVWTANWYVDDELVCEGWIAKACFLDRYGGAYYPENFDPKAWGNSSAAKNYDRDGGDVATIRITGTEPREVKIRIQTNDLSSLTKSITDTRSSCLALYHWTLRPTENNY